MVNDLSSFVSVSEEAVLPRGDGFVPSGFALLHHTPNGLDLVEVEFDGLSEIREPDSIIIDGYNSGLWELSSDSSVTFRVTLPEKYQKSVKPGERYTLLWPGGKVAAWDWGTVYEHVGQRMTKKDISLSLPLPGGAHVSFTAVAESDPWPQRAEREARVGFIRANMEEERWRRAQAESKSFPYVSDQESDPEAPKLRVNLECLSTLPRDLDLNVTVKVTYDACPGARPIIFRVREFRDHNNFQLGRLHNKNWEICDDDDSGGGGFLIVDEPDVPIKVSHDDGFVSLQPGESWATLQNLKNGWIDLPDDAQDGEALRYIFIGATLDWWDWGTKTEHEETVVVLPCFLSGPVVDPKDNNGRPKLVVPPSNIVDFFVGRQSETT